MINSQDVRGAMIDVLFEEHEETEPNVTVEGIMGTYAMHPLRLEKHREQIIAWLEELPDEFKLEGGGGWSFLNVCQTKDGVLWTGDHAVCEWLLVMAIGLKLGFWLLPRDIWPALPGGMPYFTYDNIRKGVTDADAQPESA